MAEYGPGFDWTMIAEWDFSTAQYKASIVSSSVSNKCQVASQARDRVFGIIQNKVQSGESARIRVLGISKVIAGAALNAADILVSDAAGFAITGNSANAFGCALQDAASGSIFTALIVPRFTASGG